jgi:glucose/arabinose dehydrogenase
MAGVSGSVPFAGVRNVLVGGALALATLGVAPRALAVDPPIRLQSVATGLTQPVFVAHAPGDPSRLFIVEQRGKVKVMVNGVMQATPFIDVGTRLTGSDGYVLEYGLLGIAFHPDFQHNGYFYLNYTVGTSNLADTVIARFRVSANPNVADAASFQQILRIPYTIKQHRSGWMDFDQSGLLYIPTGDGGELDPQNNASNTNVLMGKILRLDINGPDGIPGTSDDDGFPADANKYYQIPATNPYVGLAGFQPEIWAYGLRNAWRCSFDRETHDLWIGDVGQSAKEEVDVIPAGTNGGFLGWRCRERTTPTGYAGCPTTLPPSLGPTYEYTHAVGTAVIGGYVYRGCAMPDLRGTYFFGDWNNKIFSFRYVNNAVTGLVERTATLPIPNTFVSFGEDFYGELYACNWTTTAGAGSVWKIVPVTPAPDANANGIPDSCESLCATDMTGSDGLGTPDGAVDINDLFFFLTSFENGTARADLDNGSGAGTQDGAVDINDLLYFLIRFEAGC